MFEDILLPPSLSDQVKRQIRRLERRGYQDFNKTVQLIFGWHRPSLDFNEGLREWSTLVQALEGYGLYMGEDSFARMACPRVALAYTHLVGSELPLNQQGLSTLKRRHNEAVILRDKFRRSDAATMLSYLKVMISDYQTRLSAVEQLRAAFKGQDLEELVEEFAVADIDVAELAGRLDELRRYGVKPCVIHDGLLHTPETSWVFTDPSEYRNLGSIDTRFASPLAITHLAVSRSIRRLKPEITRRHGDGVVSVDFGFKPSTLICLYADGRLTTDLECGVVAADYLFRDAGVEAAYPLFQVIHFLRLYDLIVPVYALRHARIESWPRRTHRKQSVPQWRELVIPRVRLLQDTAKLDAAFAAEQSDARALTERLTTKIDQSRSITGFLRHLPAGRKATPRARLLAWQERGIAEIPDGFTYVKDHQWGSGPDATKGHRAKRREP